MQYIQDPTAVSVRPPAPALTGPVGWFAPAVPGISVATRLRYWFVNMIMSELLNVCLRNGVNPDGSSEYHLNTAIRNMIRNNGEVVGNNMVVYHTPGTFAFTVPDDVVGIDVQMWGGGSGSWASTTSISGGGGSSGGYVRAAAPGFGPPLVISGVVGAGGFGGVAGSPGTPPTPGGSSSISAGAFGGTLVAAGGVLNPLNSVGAPSFGNLAGTMGSVVFPDSQVLMVGSDGQTGIGIQGGMGSAAPLGGGCVNSGTTGRPGYWPGGGASGAGCPSGVHYDGAAGANGCVMIRF